MGKGCKGIGVRAYEQGQRGSGIGARTQMKGTAAKTQKQGHMGYRRSMGKDTWEKVQWLRKRT